MAMSIALFPAGTSFWIHRSATLHHSADDLMAEVGERQNLINESRFGHKSGHPPNDRGRLVLNEDLPTRIAYLLAAVEAVLTHAGHHHCEHVRSIRVGGGAKENVNRWATRMFWGAGICSYPCSA